VELIQELFRRIYNVPELIRMGGLVGLVVVVFAETGLMVGFFLPGDSLLFTAGPVRGQGDLNIVWLNLAVMAAAIVRRRHRVLDRAPGRQGALQTGRTRSSSGSSTSSRPTKFYEKHGGKRSSFARFVPVIRTFAPVVAGAAEMGYRQFAIYNIAGGIGWVASMTLTGYFLGRAVPDIDKHIHIVVAVGDRPVAAAGLISIAREKMKGRHPRPSS